VSEIRPCLSGEEVSHLSKDRGLVIFKSPKHVGSLETCGVAYPMRQRQIQE
jgi:hypothetical protein